jgi:hypothetical protein
VAVEVEAQQAELAELVAVAMEVQVPQEQTERQILAAVRAVAVMVALLVALAALV